MRIRRRRTGAAPTARGNCVVAARSRRGRHQAQGPVAPSAVAAARRPPQLARIEDLHTGDQGECRTGTRLQPASAYCQQAGRPGRRQRRARQAPGGRSVSSPARDVRCRCRPAAVASSRPEAPWVGRQGAAWIEARRRARRWRRRCAWRIRRGAAHRPAGRSRNSAGAGPVQFDVVVAPRLDDQAALRCRRRAPSHPGRAAGGRPRSPTPPPAPRAAGQGTARRSFNSSIRP